MVRRGVDSAHKLIIEKEKWMYMLKAAHNSLGHRGFFAMRWNRMLAGTVNHVIFIKKDRRC